MTYNQKKPTWLKVRPPNGEKYNSIKNMLSSLKLETVCQEALCPNIQECWSSGTATFMLMGDTCTRACKFCAVKTGNPNGWLDKKEPYNVGLAISKMNLDYVVLTSVDRDDLEDLGSGHFAKTIKTIKSNNSSLIIEVLTPDFNAKYEYIKKIIDAGPEVFAHNIETISRLTPKVRDRRSSYKQSLHTLKIAKELSPHTYTKSSIMLGLGEKRQEVISALEDLRGVDCDIVTFGQYLAPTNRHKKYLPVVEYIEPEIFDIFSQEAKKMGFLYAASGPLVRSSYKAGEFFIKSMIKKSTVPKIENRI